MPETMRAAVIHKAGAPDALQLEDRPIPEPENGQVLIRVHAFGLNRSELFTRQGLSPGGTLILVSFLPVSSTVISSMGYCFLVGSFKACDTFIHVPTT